MRLSEGTQMMTLLGYDAVMRGIRGEGHDPRSKRCVTTDTVYATLSLYMSAFKISSSTFSDGSSPRCSSTSCRYLNSSSVGPGVTDIDRGIQLEHEAQAATIACNAIELQFKQNERA